MKKNQQPLFDRGPHLVARIAELIAVHVGFHRRKRKYESGHYPKNHRTAQECRLGLRKGRNRRNLSAQRAG